MKTVVIAVLMFGAWAGQLYANGGEQFPFHVGEKLTYQIFWGPFVVGRATLDVNGIQPVDGHDCYHLIAKAKTSGLAELLFPVDSTTESWFDAKGLFTRRYAEDRSEGKKQYNSETHYDYDQKVAITTNNHNGKVTSMPLTGPVQDVVSSIYYMRTRQLLLDAEQRFTVHANHTNYVVNILADQRKTLWVRPVGDIEALRMEPHPTLKIVAANKGRLWFWVSDDDRRLPLLVATEMKIGNAKLVLFKIESANPLLRSRNGPARAAGPAVSPPVAAKID